MSTWSLVTVLACAHLAGIPHDGLITERKPQLHEHPTLVAMADYNNVLRQQYGLAAHRVSPYLTRLAQRHAEWMASTRNFAHNYQHPFPEVIYWNAASIHDAFHGWLNSGAHRAIMMSNTRSAGFGYAVSDSGQTYWCGIYANVLEPRILKP
jgi:uncharacterized protein YkwD